MIYRANGNLKDELGRPVDDYQRVAIDPDCRMIALHLYAGLLQIIPIDNKGQLQEAFNVRLDEANVVDMKFLYGAAKPTIALLYQVRFRPKLLLLKQFAHAYSTRI